MSRTTRAATTKPAKNTKRPSRFSANQPTGLPVAQAKAPHKATRKMVRKR